ncbi:hypothetical protein [Clostridium frigidicarnis]|uniref:Uncharacterized protein n=1 Tax=Clostridium frigidicarnis TaxID=84698 RepID=A0A1I0YIJ1_9CLOT|nr:hypothetical protein [Clostridium frigidicarnis]SFB13021.1 hypothetical protein SAMN04488528_101362 [Clostridium frigidicarnis]
MKNYVCPTIDCNLIEKTEDEAWVLVFMAALLAVGTTWFIGMSVWCLNNGYKGFTGNYELVEWGLKVNFECK